MKTVLLVGATGLVGQAVLEEALANASIARLVAPTRRPLPTHPRLENPVVDFDALPAAAAWWAVDAVICTLGTTIKQAGSRPAFRHVDHDYPLAVATLARRHGATAFAFTSSLGANPQSRSFYLRTKGETERALAGCGFSSLTIVRPSVIGGERLRRRPLETLAQTLFRGLGPFLPPRYHIVPAKRIARALLAAALAALPGEHVLESEVL